MACHKKDFDTRQMDNRKYGPDAYHTEYCCLNVSLMNGADLSILQSKKPPAFAEGSS
jgi:prenyltransferase beta subunit